MDAKTLRAVKLLVLLVLGSYFLSAGNMIQEVDPAQYAEIAREMVESNDWLVLRDNYGPYLDKPPVTIWMIAVCYKLFGVNNFAFRLPTILSAILSVLFLGLLARRLYDKNTAWLSMLIIASCEAFFLMVADPKIDMVLVLFLTLSFWSYFEAKERHWFFYLFYIFIGMAVMTKGPIGFMIPLMAIGMEWLFLRDFREIWRMKPVSGALILALVVAPWYVALYREVGPHGPYFMLWEQSFGRIFIREFKNSYSPLFFTHTFLWAFLPWSVAVIYMMAVRLNEFRKDNTKTEYRPRRILVWWFVLPFIFISLSSYKLPQYVFWLMPPAAVLLADFLNRNREYEQRKWHVHLMREQAIMAVVIIVILVVTLVWCFPISKPWLWMVIAALAAAMTGLALARLGRLKTLALLPGASLLCFNIMFYIHIYPQALDYQYGYFAGKMVKELDPDTKTAYTFKLKVSKALAFYSGRKVEPKQVDQIKDMVKSGRPVYLLARDTDLTELESGIGSGYKVESIASFPDYHTSRLTKKFLLESTRPYSMIMVVLVKISPL